MMDPVVMIAKRYSQFKPGYAVSFNQLKQDIEDLVDLIKAYEDRLKEESETAYIGQCAIKECREKVFGKL